MTAKRFHVVTPFPSMKETAKKLGASRSEVVRIERLVDVAVHASKKASSARLGGATLRKRAPR